MTRYLVTGGPGDPLLPQLVEAIHEATQIDLAVAFIKRSGIDLLERPLADALELRGVRLRILTSDYLDVTDPQALRRLLLLQERGADVCVFEARDGSFHLKSYIFLRGEDGEITEGNAFVGSSNITRPALTDGLEWNYRVALTEGGGDEDRRRFEEVRTAFETLLCHPDVVSLDEAWVDDYERRRRPDPVAIAPGSDEREPEPPRPLPVQQEALAALAATRREGYRRGLVVMATGLGKTYLAAFDTQQMNAARVLFVAHREEILLQAEATFQDIRPRARVGRYDGTRHDEAVDLLFASVQTLGREEHLERFAPDRFDYIVVDEFHHAAARTYRRVLGHFRPRFLLGLTATPERTDQSDILSLCDDNLVYTRNLFDGVTLGFLCPFTYHGIYDEHVDYEEIPWRNGGFDLKALSNHLATLARARHALRQWREHRQRRTLAFCVSTRHADFMAQQFVRAGVRAAAVYNGSALSRSKALEALAEGSLEVVFSVDLFNEGVDLPAIDTVLMLRPTESKVLFLQQLGRGLRTAPDKERLVVLDFIGNHKGFLNKPQALLQAGDTLQEMAALGRRLATGEVDLPPGCYVNYDLEIIEFLRHLASTGIAQEYEALKASLTRRPTAAEFFRAGQAMQQVRRQYGQWWKLVAAQGDLDEYESAVLEAHGDFLREVEATALNKSFKMVLLEALLAHDGFRNPPLLDDLAVQAHEVFARRRPLLADLPPALQALDEADPAEWRRYWGRNPVNAWLGGNRAERERAWFRQQQDRFKAVFSVAPELLETFQAMVQELVECRLAEYGFRLRNKQAEAQDAPPAEVVPFPTPRKSTELPFFPNIPIACGHFRSSVVEQGEPTPGPAEYRSLGEGHGNLDPARHFIARAVGNSMNGGRDPIQDGDYLLLELVAPDRAGSITNQAVVIERLGEGRDAQYLLRRVRKTPEGRYVLEASNPDYELLQADDQMRTLARLREKLDPLELALGEDFLREDIPPLFGETFNPGKWNVGHVVLTEPARYVLLVTLNKQGKEASHRYHDYFVDAQTFHWQSQRSTTPRSRKGQEIIEHEKRGVPVHLFVRESKLSGKKAAPFRYLGRLRYEKHEGSAPMNVTWKLVDA